MPPPTFVLPTRSQINKCGKYMTKAIYDPTFGPVDPAKYETAIKTVSDFRAAHAYPMLRVRIGLRSMVLTSGASSAAVTQRLKRVPRIARKLHRLPAMPLASLEDIGGVRAVLADGPELEAAKIHIMRQWSSTITRDRDYVSSPKASGYRAVHLVVERDGRSIEVQLRTKGQQEWAEAVEAADARHSLNLKDGTGPPEMMEYFAVAGEVIYLREYGLAIPRTTLLRFDAARIAVVAAGYYSA